MRKTLILIAILFLFLCVVARGQSPNVTWVAVIDRAQNEDFNGMEFYQLKRKNEAPLLTVQGTTELAAFLRQNDGKRVIVTIEVAGKLER